MASLGALSIKITGDVSQFNKDIASVEKQLNKQTRGLQTVARSMTTVGDSMIKGISLPIIAIGAGLLKLGNDFDRAYDTIRVGTGATGQDLENLKDDFREIAKVAPSSFADIGKVVADLNTRLGLTGKPLQNLSVQMLNLARITKSDINTLIPLTTRVFGDWNIATDKQSESLDYMFKVSQSTGITVDQLSQKVVYFGAALRQMGFDFETSAALIGKFEKEGVNAEVVLASLRIALGRMADEGVTDTNEALLTLIDRIKSAGSTGEANSIAMDTFGKKAGVDMASAIREGRFELDDLVDSLKGSTDTINAAAKATEDWQEKLTLLKNNLALSIEPLANKVFDSLGRGIDKLTPKIVKIAEWFGNLTDAQQDNLLKWGLITAALPFVISGFSRATTWAINMRAAMLKLNVVMKASIFGSAGAFSAAAFGVVGGITNATLAGIELNKVIRGLKDGTIGWGEATLRIAGPMTTKLTDLLKITDDYNGWLVKLGIKTEELVTINDDHWKSITAVNTAKHQGREIDVQAIATSVDYENTLQGLMTQYGFTRAQAEEYYNETEEGTEAIDDQTQSVDKLRGAFNSLIGELFDGINANNELQEAQWAQAEAQEKVNELVKAGKTGTLEYEQALNALDSADQRVIESQYKVYTSIFTTKEEQEKAREEALNYGLQMVASGKWGEDAFIAMATQFGLSAEEISKFTNGTINPALETTQEKLDTLGSTVATPKVTLDTSEADKALSDLQTKLNSMNFAVYKAKLNALDSGFASGGIVGYANGGVISASAGMITPSFDNGGILTMLHKNEVVLNSKQTRNLAELIFGLANTKHNISGSGINNTYNITSPKPLSEGEIKRQLDMLSREMGYRMGVS